MSSPYRNSLGPLLGAPHRARRTQWRQREKRPPDDAMSHLLDSFPTLRVEIDAKPPVSGQARGNLDPAVHPEAHQGHAPRQDGYRDRNDGFNVIVTDGEVIEQEAPAHQRRARERRPVMGKVSAGQGRSQTRAACWARSPASTTERRCPRPPRAETARQNFTPLWPAHALRCTIGALAKDGSPEPVTLKTGHYPPPDHR
jgi:hypothetical protein